MKRKNDGDDPFEEFSTQVINLTREMQDRRRANDFLDLGATTLIECDVPAWQVASKLSAAVGVVGAAPVAKIASLDGGPLAAALKEMTAQQKLPLIVNPRYRKANKVLADMLKTSKGRILYRDVAVLLQRATTEAGLRQWMYYPDGRQPTQGKDDRASRMHEDAEDREEGSGRIKEKKDLVDLLNNPQHEGGSDEE